MNLILIDKYYTEIANTLDNLHRTECQTTGYLPILFLHYCFFEAQNKHFKRVVSETLYVWGPPCVLKPDISLRGILCIQNSIYHRYFRAYLQILIAQNTHWIELPYWNIFQWHLTRCLLSRWILIFYKYACLWSSWLFIFWFGVSLYIPVDHLRELILLCTRYIRSGFEGIAYSQTDG